MATPQLKLTYFDAAGRAELTRLALAFGNIPFDAVAALRVDMIVETLVDLTTAFATAFFAERDEVLRAEKTKVFAGETVPKTLGTLESMVQGEFFGGDSISLADLHLFDLVTNGLGIYSPGFTTAPFPKLEAVMENVKANTNIAAYLAKSNP
ncbi:hypothetical protein PybrP1_012093 [[Pythium] brassicae (nom. inval.)]|nr:hypothetical protein PybrP1_012093 [[Pythium] brassicae (nom. inval.)]